MKVKQYPEVRVMNSFLNDPNGLFTRGPIRFDDFFISVEFEHDVLGLVIETFFENPNSGLLILKHILLRDMDSFEELEIAEDYYNNFLLKGHKTYLPYYNKDLGYFLSTRNFNSTSDLFRQ